MTPNNITALVTKDGKLSKDQVPLPTPDENQLLVKVSHVAQNPTDGMNILQETYTICNADLPCF